MPTNTVVTPVLALTPEDRARAGELLLTLLDDYERGLPTAPLVPEFDEEALTDLLSAPISREGIGVEGVFAEIKNKIIPNSTALASPRFLAYVSGPPNGIAPYAEAIAAALNQNCNFWQLGPAASVVERAVLRWLAELVGYPPDAGGILTGGGSIATLNALVTALNAVDPDFRANGLQARSAPAVVYTSTEAHRSVDKAAAILGIGLDHVRHIPVDDQHRTRVDALAEAIAADRQAGLAPFCVVATSGTVTTGSVDPLNAIADLCEREELWLHVDGAYGALFRLGTTTRDLLDGIERADSITLDPHKMLFASLEAGCLLVRDRKRLRDAFAFNSSYLTIAEHPVMVDFMDYGPQLSRGFKALKVWTALQAFGTDAFRAAVDQTLELAQHLAERVRRAEELELMAPVPLTAVCIRLRGATDTDHTEILAQLAREGTALLGPANVNGRMGIRACVTNYRTRREDIDLVVDRLCELARSVESGRQGRPQQQLAGS
ncbi:pyridoxal-dependent decarboxylase [Kutzneria sp. NPDC051319]|uniref:pyridoxal phosphate-dependent decarboxylase family protein n=1 Tax=Kutzneria sp. NPDC051319 TaxID=3155047 RepID=UPI0034190386